LKSDAPGKCHFWTYTASQYVLDKVLFAIDRDPDLVERYREKPREALTWWEAHEANRLPNRVDDERFTCPAFTDEERSAQQGRSRSSGCPPIHSSRSRC
jgi:hypothetical protein